MFVHYSQVVSISQVAMNCNRLYNKKPEHKSSDFSFFFLYMVVFVERLLFFRLRLVPHKSLVSEQHYLKSSFLGSFVNFVAICLKK